MCRFYKILYFILPFKNIKSVLIKKHFSVCEVCQVNSQLKKDLSEVEALKAWASKENSVWPEIKSALQIQEVIKANPKKNLTSQPFRIWRWAASLIAVTIVVAISLLIQKGQKTDVLSDEMQLAESFPKVILKRAELNGKKARPVIYQTSTVSIIFLVEDKEPGGINE
ncbi:MAG: hypothetical protein MUP22_03665 [Desulfobacterales bacterium]|nr:hypothetical protein [Desulfobacterales bacterium]